MADESNSFGDFLQAAAAVAAAYALNAAVSGALAPQQKAAGVSVTVNDPRPSKARFVGLASRGGGAFALVAAQKGVYDAVIAVHDGRLNAYKARYLNDDVVTRGMDGRVVTVNGGTSGPYLDDPDPRVIIEERLGVPTETAYASVVSDWPGLWSSACRGDDTASLHLRCIAPKPKFQAAIFPNHIPKLSVAAEGVAYDWRDGSQARLLPETWKPTGNLVVAMVHEEVTRFGRDWTRCVAPTLTDLTASADVCDEAVALAAGGTIPRYAGGFNYRVAETKPADVRAKFLEAMDGWFATTAGGALIIKPGQYEEPTVTITSADIVSCTWSQGIDDDEAVTDLSLSFRDPANLYKQVECDPWIDGGSGKSDSFDAEAVQHFAQMRRLGKIRFNDLNTRSETLVTTLRARAGLRQRYLRLQYPRRPAMADVVVKVRGVKVDLMNDRITWQIAPASAAAYAWDAASEEGSPVATVPRPTYTDLAPATITALTAVPSPYGSASGIRLSVTATCPARADITPAIRWRVPGDATWSNASFPDVDASSGSFTVLSPIVQADAALEVEAAYFTATAFAPWPASPSTVDTRVTMPAPSTPTGLALTTPVAGSIAVAVTAPSSATVLTVRIWRNTANNFATATLITTLVCAPSQALTYTDPGRTAATVYYYWAVAADAAGQTSSPTGEQHITAT